jgi:imidazolonepropionase-like amidohydrolase
MNRTESSIVISAFFLFTACTPTSTPAPGDNGSGAAAPAEITFFNAAHLIPGDGSATIDEPIFVVNAGKVEQLGKKGDFAAPKGAGRTDLKEQTRAPSASVIPALINVSGFPGLSRGQKFGADNYEEASVIDDLKRYEYYGVLTVASGGADAGDIAFRVRDNQRQGKVDGATYLTPGRGITAKGGYPANILKGVPMEVVSEDEARKAVQELAGHKVDFIKLFVNGSPKLSPPVFKAVIDEAKKNGLRVFADAPALADAKELVAAGVAGFVNSVTDAEVDDALISSMKANDVFYAPALTALEARFVYADSPNWLRRPYMREAYPTKLVAYLSDTVTVNKFKRNQAAAAFRAEYGVAKKNLKKLSDGGVTIALGTGSGLADTYPGFFEHRELELMVESGLSTADAIKAATAGSSKAVGLADVGALATGKNGNFIVTTGNPIENIADTQSAQQVYWKGVRIDQAAPEVDTTDIGVSPEERQRDAKQTEEEKRIQRIAAMTHYGPWPAAKSVSLRGLSIPVPFNATANAQAGPPDKITIRGVFDYNERKGADADWREFYGKALSSWKAVGNCWERAHTITKKTETLCIEPNGASAVVQITEK